MEEIFDSSKMIGKVLHVTKTVALDRIEHDRAIQMIKRDMAIHVADMIMKDDDFFKSSSDDRSGKTMINYRADCVVLTQDEYAQIKREAFKQGINHAYGFMPADRNPA